MIEDIIEKVGKYNILNYLLPGVVYVYLLSELCNINLIQENLLIGGFLYYFIGMLISRVGSLIIAPIYKLIKVVTYKEYKEFIVASEKDPKLNTLSTENNMYRTFTALFLLGIISKFYCESLTKYPWIQNNIEWIILIGLFLIFTLAYRKQTGFISERINKNIV